MRRYWKYPKRNLHRSLTFLIFIAQVFGFFPVQPLWTDNVNKLQFKWFHFKVFWSFGEGFLALILSLNHLRFMIVRNKYDQFDMNGACFYFVGSLSSYLFIRLAKEWPLIVREFRKVERSFESSYGWPKTIDRRIQIMSFIFLGLEAVEHLTIQIHKFVVSYDCKGGYSEGFKHFSVNLSFPQVFEIVPYSPYLGVLLQLCNSKMAFSWTFVDLFIIIMSTYLAARFIQVTDKLKLIVETKCDCTIEWRAIREDYNKLSRLSRMLNRKLSPLILLSFTTNFYFIIFQLYEDMSVIETTMELVYFIISFGFILIRISSVCIYGSWINEETNRLKLILLSTQQDHYNIEIERFIQTVKLETVGLSGNDYFRLTRSLILKIAGAVVTYELVIIHFTGKALMEKKVSRNSMC